MALSDKLRDWQKAGLITPEVAARIAEYEDEQARPLVLWAVVGLGCLALALGIVTIVKANWDVIPDAVKLASHYLFTGAAAFAAWLGLKRKKIWQTEGALFLLGALTLAGLALHAQVYQLTGPVWALIMWWLLLAGPVLLLIGRTRLTAYALGGMALWFAGAWASSFDGETVLELVAQGAAMGAPWLLVALGGLAAMRPRFASGLTETGLIVLLTAVSLAHVVWADPVNVPDAGDMRVRLLMTAALVGMSIWLARTKRTLPRALVLPLLGAPFAALVLAIGFEHGDGPLPRLVGAFIFAAMWGWIAWEASRTGWRALFGLAIGALAVRLFIVYIELFGSQAYTGFGLIITGALVIGLALGGRRLFRSVRT